MFWLVVSRVVRCVYLLLQSAEVKGQVMPVLIQSGQVRRSSSVWRNAHLDTAGHASVQQRLGSTRNHSASWNPSLKHSDPVAVYLEVFGPVLQQHQLEVRRHGDSAQVDRQEVVVKAVQVVKENGAAAIVTRW